VYLGRIGSLSTLSRKQPGFPFGSVMPYGLDDHGSAIFLISTMAMHTQNLQADPRSSLLVTQPDATGDPLGASRVTLVGKALPVPEPEVAEARKLYLARYANSKYWVDFEDFSFYRMEVVDVYYVGGFGVMGWVSSSEYTLAQPDPLVDAATGIIQHMNTHHGSALIELAHAFAGIESEEVTMTSVDRLGFHIRGSLSCGKYTIPRKPEALSWKWWPNLEKSERPCRSHRIKSRRHSCVPCQFSRHRKLWHLPLPGWEAAVLPLSAVDGAARRGASA
jgi:putative heme iron utilization protein